MRLPISLSVTLVLSCTVSDILQVFLCSWPDCYSTLFWWCSRWTKRDDLQLQDCTLHHRAACGKNYTGG